MGQVLSAAAATISPVAQLMSNGIQNFFVQIFSLKKERKDSACAKAAGEENTFSKAAAAASAPVVDTSISQKSKIVWRISTALWYYYNMNIKKDHKAHFDRL